VKHRTIFNTGIYMLLWN